MWGVQQINNPSIWSSHIITYHHQFAWFLPDYILITSMFWKSKPFGLFTCNMDVWGVLGLHLHPHVHLPFSLCFCIFFGVLGEGLLCAAVTALVTRATLVPQVRWWNTQISGRKELFNLLWSPKFLVHIKIYQVTKASDQSDHFYSLSFSIIFLSNANLFPVWWTRKSRSNRSFGKRCPADRPWSRYTGRLERLEPWHLLGAPWRAMVPADMGLSNHGVYHGIPQICHIYIYIYYYIWNILIFIFILTGKHDDRQWKIRVGVFPYLGEIFGRNIYIYQKMIIHRNSED